MIRPIQHKILKTPFRGYLLDHMIIIGHFMPNFKGLGKYYSLLETKLQRKMESIVQAENYWGTSVMVWTL